MRLMPGCVTSRSSSISSSNWSSSMKSSNSPPSLRGSSMSSTASSSEKMSSTPRDLRFSLWPRLRRLYLGWLLSVGAQKDWQRQRGPGLALPLCHLPAPVAQHQSDQGRLRRGLPRLRGSCASSCGVVPSVLRPRPRPHLRRR